jgi:hypothetical protein
LDLLPKKFRDKYERENGLFKKLMTERTSKKKLRKLSFEIFFRQAESTKSIFHVKNNVRENTYQK